MVQSQICSNGNEVMHMSEIENARTSKQPEKKKSGADMGPSAVDIWRYRQRTLVQQNYRVKKESAMRNIVRHVESTC